MSAAEIKLGKLKVQSHDDEDGPSTPNDDPVSVTREELEEKGPARMPKFGEGLLPVDAQADTAGQEQQHAFSIKTKLIDISFGFFYIELGSGLLGYDFSFGLDMSLHELKSPLLYRAIIMEFFATFLFLFFTIATAVFRAQLFIEDDDGGAANQLMVATVFGFMIFLMVYLAAPVSGGHINPAVSIGLMITRKITFVRMVLYVGAQVAGATAGAFTVRALNRSVYEEVGGGANAIADIFTSEATYGAEIIGTGLLMVIVNATVDPIRAGEVIHISVLGPFAIGMAVFMAHLALIPIDGCSINPARSFGTAAAMGDFTNQGVFWGGPIGGALIASFLYETFFKARKSFEKKWEDRAAHHKST